jgi:hypothetical protein
MAVLNYSDVTRSIINLIEQFFTVSPDWQNAAHVQLATPNVFPEPPQKLVADGLGFYLYHVRENASFKNILPPGNDFPPIRFMPLALDLYYQLTANSTAGGDNAAYNEQLMMSIAMKGFHDYPLINDATNITGAVFTGDLTGSGARLKISLQPIAYNEAVQYWTAGTYPVKLAAYYEINVILFEPDVPKTYAGRVLTYGTFVFTEGPPTILSASNTLSFKIPGTTTIQNILVQPAQVTPGNNFTVYGNNFDGTGFQLLLISSLWSEPGLPDATWIITRQGADTLNITVGKGVTLAISGTAETLVPGIFSLQITVNRTQTAPGGILKHFIYNSNQFPFSITPNITAPAPVPAGAKFTVTGFLFQNANIGPGAIQIMLGPNQLEQSTGVPLAGQFQVTGATTMDITLPASAVAGNILPLRILVNGAESAPNWVTVT